MRLQRLLLGLEEVGPRLAPLSALPRVAVVGVARNGHVIVSLPQILSQRVRGEPGTLVVNEVLQVVGVPALLGEAEQDHRLRDEDPAAVLLRRHTLVHHEVGVVERLDLLGEDAPAVLRAHGEEALPAVFAEAALPEFQRPVTGQRGVAPSDAFLHRRGHLAELVTALGAEIHRIVE